MPRQPGSKNKLLRKYLPEEKPIEQIYARIDANLHKKVMAICKSEHISIYKIVEIALLRLVEDFEKKT